MPLLAPVSNVNFVINVSSLILSKLAIASLTTTDLFLLLGTYSCITCSNGVEYGVLLLSLKSILPSGPPGSQFQRAAGASAPAIN